MFSRFSRVIPRTAAAFTATRTFSTASKQFNTQQSSNTARFLKYAATGVALTTAAAFGIANCADKTPFQGVPGTKNERTFIAIKPDGTARGLIGEIIHRFERKGYKLVAIKILHPTKEQAEAHYADLSSKPFFNGLVKFFSSGAIVAMVWEGKGVIKGGRSLVGATDPAQSLPGSIRGDLCVEVGRNIVHGSDGPESAQHEIKLWFKENEFAEWNSIQPVYEN
ncbi:nucleoside diphosphate kinase [Heterostelium album PN500]|uniref:Nucleoside diphosphate kinase n=1 Tax=Heterostelium pallidum (strain ATCC 26659 / Pp 5 / PN500) TaxID=670386 RepID=D3BL27_HETP5|nr:nucleoside diphosphate kinase [Heterostelium album PN500]EFA77761.1 nucleoside diphosphate kinase [Heterostelium album PN500]|eukprot:XP_020429889.1 nucleoside diphosphate kinase [Heterostelium album PN500]